MVNGYSDDKDTNIESTELNFAATVKDNIEGFQEVNRQARRKGVSSLVFHCNYVCISHRFLDI